MRSLLVLGSWLCVAGSVSAQCFLEKLHQSESPPGESFGQAVAIAGDWAVVGAPLGGSDEGPGRAYVFRREGSQWHEDAMLSGDSMQMFGAGPGDQFGAAVAVEEDRVIVSAPFEHVGGVLNAGAVYVFHKSGTAWSKEARLVSPTPETQKLFGRSVDVDGDVLVIGEPALFPLTAQRAQVFRWNGAEWAHEQTLHPPQFVLWEGFGYSVGVDDEWILVGAPHSLGDPPNEGEVYAYQFNGSQWLLVDSFVSSTSSTDDTFGFSLAVDGTRALIGGWTESKAWIFEHDGANWVERQILTGGPGDAFGWSVALRAGRALVGAPSDNVTPASDCGTAHLFQLEGLQWKLGQQFVGPDKASDDNLGRAVALDGSSILIGAPKDDDGGPDTGSAYSFSAYEDLLVTFSDSISLASGGVQHLGLDAGTKSTGNLYLTVSTGSGTCAGTGFGSVIVPVNVDIFTTYSIAHANQPPFASTFGVLDEEGQANAAIHIAPGTSPALVGMTLHHAFVVLDHVTLAVLSASNSVSLSFLALTNRDKRCFLSSCQRLSGSTVPSWRRIRSAVFAPLPPESVPAEVRISCTFPQAVGSLPWT